MSGSRGTVEGIGLPFREAIEYFRQKTNTPSEHWTDVWRTAHARSFMVAGAASDALLSDFRAEIMRALEQGTTLADFRKAFDEIVARHGWVHNGEAGWRARIIYETNLSMAYAAGRYAQQTEPDTLAAFPYWRYVHSRARHPRLQHLAWDGLTLRADDPWWNTHYPPNGWRCGCRVRSMTARGVERLGRDGPDVAPEILTRPWTNPRTGQVQQVPVGIDPGFDYNPGQAWLRRDSLDIPADARWRSPPAPPPVPLTQAERGAQPLVPPGTPVEPARDFTIWADSLLASRRSDGTVRVVGEISERVMGWLRERGDAPESSALAITSSQLLHLARDAKRTAGKAIAIEDIRAERGPAGESRGQGSADGVSAIRSRRGPDGAPDRAPRLQHRGARRRNATVGPDQRGQERQPCRPRRPPERRPLRADRRGGVAGGVRLLAPLGFAAARAG